MDTVGGIYHTGNCITDAALGTNTVTALTADTFSGIDSIACLLDGLAA